MRGERGVPGSGKQRELGRKHHNAHRQSKQFHACGQELVGVLSRSKRAGEKSNGRRHNHPVDRPERTQKGGGVIPSPFLKTGMIFFIKIQEIKNGKEVPSPYARLTLITHLTSQISGLVINPSMSSATSISRSGMERCCGHFSRHFPHSMH